MAWIDDIIFAVLYILIIIASNYASFKIGYNMGSLDTRIAVLDALIKQTRDLVDKMNTSKKDGDD